MEKDEILDTSVAIERDNGVITLFSLIEHPHSINKFEILFPDLEDYSKAIQISESLRKIGKPIGAIDILISAMCLNRKSKLITKDKDFNYVKNVFSDFKLELI